LETTAAEHIMPPEIALEDMISSKVDSSDVPTVEVSSAGPAVAEDSSHVETA